MQLKAWIRIERSNGSRLPIDSQHEDRHNSLPRSANRYADFRHALSSSRTFSTGNPTTLPYPAGDFRDDALAVFLNRVSAALSSGLTSARHFLDLPLCLNRMQRSLSIPPITNVGSLLLQLL